MNEEKQIEEMAKDLQETHDYEGCEAWHCGGCEYEKYGKGYFCSSIKQAEKMTVKGYRKASEVVDEFVKLLKERLFSVPTVYNSHFGRIIDKVSEELKKKYTEEGK